MAKNYYQTTGAGTAQLEIDYLRDQLNQARRRLRDVLTSRENLKSHGYFVTNLWHIDDVMDKYYCDKEEAYEVLEKVLLSDYMMVQIWENIDGVAKQLGYEKKLKGHEK
jgi:hypothetical protein